MQKHLRTVLLSAVVLGSTMPPACSKKAAPVDIQSRGESFFAAEEYDKARIEFMNLLRADAVNPLAIKRMGLIWIEQGSPLRAFPFLVKARELDGKDLTVLRKLAAVQLSVSKRDDARKTISDILALSPSDEEGLLLLGESGVTKEDRVAVEKILATLPDKEAPAVQLTRAALLFRSGDFAGASAAAEAAKKAYPQSMHILLLQANVAVMQKDQPGALALFKAAAELPTSRPSAKVRYAEFLMRTGDREGSKAVLKALTASKPSYLPAWEALAQSAIAENKPDEGLAYCDNIFGRDPIHYTGRLLEARMLLMKNQPKDAIAKLELQAKNFAGAPEVECQLARAYLMDGQIPQAMACLTRALTTQPDYEEAVLLQAEVNLRVGSPREAVTPLEELVKKKPGHPQAEPMLAEAYRRQGRLEDTLRIYRRRVNNDPNGLSGLLLLGTALREAGQSAEARAQFAKVLELAPSARVAIEQLLEMDVQEKKFDDARGRIAPVLAADANSAGGNYLMARIYLAEGKFAEAEEAVKKSIKADPSSIQASELYASVSLAANKLPEAIKELSALVAKQPKLAGPQLTLALLHENAAEYEKARDMYESVLALQPENAAVMNNLAYLYLVRLKDAAKGYDLAKRARTLRPDDAAVADTLGWALYLRREYPQALAALQEAVLKLGTHGEVQYHLGMAYYAMGQTEPAREALTKALAGEGKFPGKEEAERRLALLSGGEKAEMSIEQLEAMVKEQPQDVPVLLRLAEAYEKQEAYPKAEAALQQVLKENAQMIPALVSLTRLYSGPLASPEKAMTTGKKARDLAPNDPAVTAIFAKAAYQTGKASWAHSLLQESLRRLPENATAQYDLACAAYASGKVAEAERALTALTEGGEQNGAVAADARAFLDLLALERDRQNLAANEAKVQSLLTKYPGLPVALIAQAALHLQKSDAAAATAIYKSLLERFPEFAPAQTRMAAVYAEDPARLAEALTLANKARTAVPDDVEAAQLVGRLAFQKKDYAQTRTVLLKLAEQGKLDATSLYYLGMSQLQGGDSAKAKATLEQALAAELPEPMAAEARKALATLATN